MPSVRRAGHRFAVPVALALVLAPAVAAQDLLAYEGFDYGVTGTAQGLLPGGDGGFGWRNAWLGPTADGLLSWWTLDGTADDTGPFAADGVMDDGTYVFDTPRGLTWSTHSLHFLSWQKSRVDFSPHVSKFNPLMRGSITLWMKTDRVGPIMVLVGAANRSTVKSLQLFVKDGVVHYDVYGDLPAENLLLGGTDVSDGQWHHVAVTVDATEVAKLYVDGFEEAVGIQGFFGHVFNMDGMWLGKLHYANATRHFDGNIDDVAIWGNVLSPAEVRMLASLPPLLVPVQPSRSGPMLSSESLATVNRPSSAFGTFGLSPVGNRLSDNAAIPTVRVLRSVIHLGVDATYYVSCLLRMENAASNAFEVQLADRVDVFCRFGWTAGGQWMAGLQSTTATNPLQPASTYFAVCKISARAASPDSVSLKVYAPNETVGAVEPATWTVSHGGEDLGARVNILRLSRATAGSTIEVDEIRVGSTWESVTAVGYGAGCLGASIGRSNRPAIGSTNFTVKLQGGSASQPAFLNLGGSRSLWGALALPFDLTAAGAPGCRVLASIDATLPATTNAAGAASLTLPVPAQSSLLGQVLYLQWAAVDAAQTNPLALAFSNAMEAAIEK